MSTRRAAPEDTRQQSPGSRLGHVLEVGVNATLQKLRSLPQVSDVGGTALIRRLAENGKEWPKLVETSTKLGYSADRKRLEEDIIDILRDGEPLFRFTIEDFPFKAPYIFIYENNEWVDYKKFAYDLSKKLNWTEEEQNKLMHTLSMGIRDQYSPALFLADVLDDMHNVLTSLDFFNE